MVLQTDGANRITIAAGGAVSVTATSGVALTVNGIAGQVGLQVNPANSASIGIMIQDPGSNATQLRLETSNTAVSIQALGSGTTNMVLQTQEGVELTLAGGAQVGGATGGTLGLGTVNATAYYISGSDIVQTGTFTGTLTGCTTAPTATFNYTCVNNLVVTIDCQAGLSATSNSTSCNITGLPSILEPARQLNPIGIIYNNGITEVGTALMVPGQTTIFLGRIGASSLFTSSGLKGVPPGFSFSYNLL
jgi:hypothetical protein